LRSSSGKSDKKETDRKGYDDAGMNQASNRKTLTLKSGTFEGSFPESRKDVREGEIVAKREGVEERGKRFSP